MRIFIESQDVPAAINAEAAPPVFPKPETYVMEAVPLALDVFGLIVS